MQAAVPEKELEATDLAMTFDQGDCPLGREEGEELPAETAEGVLGNPARGLLLGSFWLYGKTNKVRDAGQWRCCPQGLPGSVAEPPVASGRQEAGLSCGGGVGLGGVGVPAGGRTQAAGSGELRSLG